ncbi:ABC-2 type transport system permease protein [Pilibacter termitis]|uniref:ABC-2 type transport system permease protein n=1 Tax=Pilibacter termitis TaxID=263852 RepID=A0A1T4NPV2_9ENTE|nr:hypothetical protein [Pilibacter termitis]SJZ81145.1 ABC-2 type transport system permease protein [Pilibacter termitis]
MKRNFTQTSKMLRHLFKRDWLKLLIWYLAFVSFAAGFVAPMYDIYGKNPVGLAGMYETLQNPAMIALCGTSGARSAEQFSIGAMYAQEMLLFTAIIFAIVAILHVITRTRKEEDDGMLELIRSFSVGRLANTVAVLAEMLLFHLLVGISIACLIQVQQVSGFTDFTSNLVFAFALAGQGFLWATIALFCSQLAKTSGSAKGLSIAVIGVLYILRMATDMKEVSLSYFNPLSWSYLTSVYVKNDVLPLFWTLCFSFLMLVFAFQLETRRDMNAGFLPERIGRAYAKKSLLGVDGLIFRLQKTYIISWVFGIFLGGATYGSIFGDMDKFLDTSPIMKQMFLQNPKYSIQEQFMATLFMILALLSACFALGSMMKLTTEEKRNHLEQIYAMRISRRKLYFTHFCLSIICATLGQFVATLGLWLAQLSVMKQPIEWIEIAKAGFVWLPAIYLFIGVLTLLQGFFPRFTAIIWGMVAYSFFISYFGKLVNLPKIMEKLDIFSYTPRLPIDKMNANPLYLLIFSLICVAIGFVGYKNRDLIGE